ncbi:iron chaperone [Pseudalkalibacillus sp. R45]|uniref:iron chaperone n=1 Tax=Pseudalkalibacillus sp. R45 TaxID=3457433 RepID=UPI003FCDBC45
METFTEYVANIDNPEHRDRTEEVLAWVTKKFPKLKQEIKWNTPMFTDHGTFIIGIDTAKHHMSFAPEEIAMKNFSEDIEQAGYSSTKGLFRIRWNQPVNYKLLEKIIEFNIQDKAECPTFWR